MDSSLLEITMKTFDISSVIKNEKADLKIRLQVPFSYKFNHGKFIYTYILLAFVYQLLEWHIASLILISTINTIISVNH